MKKDDKVGLYCRNRIEIVIAMLGIVKAGAILVNVNFRYVEGELRYLFENSDMVALVHERQYADRVANVLPTPESDDRPRRRRRQRRRLPALRRVEFFGAIADSSAVRDFGERSGTTSTCCTPAGRRDFRKGVMWRHEDILPSVVRRHRLRHRRVHQDEYDLAKAAAANPPMIRYPIPPMIHGAPNRRPGWRCSQANRRSGNGIRRRGGVAHHQPPQGEPAVLHR